MVKQKITIASDGVVSYSRMKLYHPNHARNTPATKLSRLQKLLKTGEPHICFVRGEGIGDVLMTTPTIHSVRQLFNNKATITYATNTRYLDRALSQVLQFNPDIDFIVERDLMKEEDYDLVVNLHCPAIKYEKMNKRPPNRINIFANHAGIQLTTTKPKYFIQKSEIEWGEQFFLSKMPHTKTILVQLFASSVSRSLNNRLIKDALTLLNNNYGIESIILKHSSDPSSDIQWDNIPGAKVVSVNIREVAAIMIHCDLVLCPDSSILHLAGALSTPTVSIFTTTYPGSRINHYPNTTAIWGGEKFAPCPCWTSINACPIRQACLSTISIDMIVEKVIQMLKGTSKVDIKSVIKSIPAVSISTEVL